MCTAISLHAEKHYFGRNLDLEGSFGEGVVISPRALFWNFRKEGIRKGGYAMIGAGIVQAGMPLYFDAVNEYGLGMAGLNFPQNAVYNAPAAGKKNVAPFEIIPYILGVCKSVAEAREMLKEVNFIDVPFSEQLPLTPLHWMVCDSSESIVVEPTREGTMIYDDPVHVLTNNPPFPMQMARLKDYLNLSPYEPEPRFAACGKAYSRGMGAMGLPGDCSSASRFVRAVFHTEHAIAGKEGGLCAFFHLLGSVAMPRGSVRLKENVFEETVYSSCCDTDAGIYYYTTYGNFTIHAVRLHDFIDADAAVFLPFCKELEVRFDENACLLRKDMLK